MNHLCAWTTWAWKTTDIDGFHYLSREISKRANLRATPCTYYVYARNYAPTMTRINDAACGVPAGRRRRRALSNPKRDPRVGDGPSDRSRRLYADDHNVLHCVRVRVWPRAECYDGAAWRTGTENKILKNTSLKVRLPNGVESPRLTTIRFRVGRVHPVGVLTVNIRSDTRCPQRLYFQSIFFDSERNEKRIGFTPMSYFFLT